MADLGTPRTLVYPYIGYFDTVVTTDIQRQFNTLISKQLAGHQYTIISDVVHADSGVRQLHNNAGFFATLATHNTRTLGLEEYPAAFQPVLDRITAMIASGREAAAPITHLRWKGKDYAFNGQPLTSIHQHIIDEIGKSRLWGHELSDNEKVAGLLDFANMMIAAQAHNVRVVGLEIQHSPDIIKKHMPSHLHDAYMAQVKGLFHPTPPFTDAATEAERAALAQHGAEMNQWLTDFRASPSFHREVAQLLEREARGGKAAAVYGSGHVHGGFSDTQMHYSVDRNQSLPHFLGRDRTATIMPYSHQRSALPWDDWLALRFPNSQTAQERAAEFARQPADRQRQLRDGFTQFNAVQSEVAIYQRFTLQKDFDAPDALFDMNTGRTTELSGSAEPREAFKRTLEDRSR